MIRFLVLTAFVLNIPVLAYADDEFGARFGNQAPPALTAGEESASESFAPQDIEPAAGDEQPMPILPEDAPMSTDIDNNADEQANEIETKL
jgi:hypothetical protein